MGHTTEKPTRVNFFHKAPSFLEHWSLLGDKPVTLCVIIIFMTPPLLVLADRDQNIFERPGLRACGQAGRHISPLDPKELIPLPQGSNLYFLPDRHPAGSDLRTKKTVTVNEGTPVAAFLPPGYTSLRSPAYKEASSAAILPLFAYTAVAFYKNALYVPALRIDPRENHNITCIKATALANAIAPFRKTHNRLIRHLADCATINGCPNAINFFLKRFEAPLPSSPACNAQCLGCISFQPAGSCPATQPRLPFSPTAAELSEIALLHIRNVPKAVVSFGQGCEGEPLLAAAVIKEAIGTVRAATAKGTIHMNTNASRPEALRSLFDAGLDSIRVSMNSARKEFYERYYAPRGYGFKDVLESISLAGKYRKAIALNYLTMPGFTDQPAEFKALTALLERQKIGQIQWRNLNYDPQLYFRSMKTDGLKECLGIKTVIATLRRKFPLLKHGYFNLPAV